jgi:hypothetical protein
MSVCHGCDAQLPPTAPGGRPRKWCSERCRKSQYAGVCEACGSPRRDGSAGRHGRWCLECSGSRARSASAVARSERAVIKYTEIETLWNEGLPMLEIASRMGLTKGALSWTLNTMRARGYDIPFRYQAYADRVAA